MSKSDLVVFSKTDPDDPKNWSRNKKRLVCIYICTLAFCAIFGSSIYATSELQIRQTYGASAVTASSGLTLYVLGFSLGPLLCPMSEMYGRKIPYSLSWPLLIFTSGICAWVNNLPVILVFRLLAGCCAGCAVNNGGAIMSDMYNVVDMQGQAVAITWYAVSIFAGSCVALPIGFFIAVYAAPHLWPLRVFFFFVIAMWPLVFLLPESHGLTILAARSKRLRRQGRPGARAAHEMKHQTKAELFRSHIGRPAGMFYLEPIVQGAAIWTSLAYGIIYLYFEIYPTVFFVQHHFLLQYTGLPFLALVIGILGAAVPYLWLVRLFQSLRMPLWIVPPGVAGPETPESRLKLALFACALMPISLFWFAWTSGGGVHWIVPTLAGVPLGFAVITIFFTFLTYTSQTYTIYAASSGACNTFARSLVGAIFPVASHSIIKNLGTEWGVSLLGFLSLAFLPIAFAFLRYGAVLRARSPYAREANNIVSKMRTQAAEQARAAAMIMHSLPNIRRTFDGTESEQFLMTPLSAHKEPAEMSESERRSEEQAVERMSEEQVVENATEKIPLERLPERISAGLEELAETGLLREMIQTEEEEEESTEPEKTMEVPQKAPTDQVPEATTSTESAPKAVLTQRVPTTEQDPPDKAAEPVPAKTSMEQALEMIPIEGVPEETPKEDVLEEVTDPMPETASTERVPTTVSTEQIPDRTSMKHALKRTSVGHVLEMSDKTKQAGQAQEKTTPASKD